MKPEIKKLGVTHKLANCELTRIDIDTEHYYFMDGEFAVSLTHILDIGAPFPEGLRNWLRNTDGQESQEYMLMTRDRGSKLHDALDRLMQDIELDKNDYPTEYERQGLTAFIRTMKFLQPAQYKTELVVGDKKRRVGGTMDFVGIADRRKLEILCDPTYKLDIDPVTDQFVLKDKYKDLLNGNPVPCKFVCDWKFTNRSTYNHRVQVTKYKQMYNESYKEEQPATDAFYWRYSPKHKFKFEMKDASIHLDQKIGEKSFDRIYETALEYMGGFPEPPEMVVYPDKFKLFDKVKS